MQLCSGLRKPTAVERVRETTEHVSLSAQRCSGPPSTSGRLAEHSCAGKYGWLPYIRNSRRIRLCPAAHAPSTLLNGEEVARPKCIKKAKQLTAEIGRCDDWLQLKDILQRRASIVNHIHLCAAFSKLPKLVPSLSHLDAARQHDFLEFYSSLCRGIQENLPCLRPRELSNVLGAAAKLGLHPGHAWVTSLVEAVYQQLDSHTAQDSGSTAWALARMNFHPGPSWSTAFVSHCGACLPDMDAQALSNLLWAFARWDYTPPQAILHSAVECAAIRMHMLTPQGLANVLWALSKLQYVPPSAWMACYWSSVHSAVLRGTMSSSELSLVLFAAGKLGCCPPEDKLPALIQSLAHRVHELSFAGSAWALWGLSMLHQRPEPLMAAWYEHTQKMMDRHLSAVPSASHRSKRVGSIDAMAFANALYAVQRLEAPSGAQAPGSCTVTAAWLQSAVNVSGSLADVMDERALAVSGLCLAKLGASVDIPWISAYSSAVQKRLKSMNSAEVANVLCAMSRLRIVPVMELMYALMDFVHEEMLRFRPNELANSLLALAHLSVGLAAEEPGPAWRSLSARMWRSLQWEAQLRWLSLPPASIGSKDRTTMRRALLLARQDVAWLEELGSRVLCDSVAWSTASQ